MRPHRWLSRIAGALLLSAGSLAQAQNYPGSMSAEGFAPGPGGATWAPGALAQGNYPSYYQPWPGMSPYESQYSQLANEAGLWQSDSVLGASSKIRVRTEYIRSRTEKGRDRIGSTTAPTYARQIIPSLQNAGAGGGNNNSLPQYISLLNSQPNSSTGTFNLYNPLSAKEIEKPELQGIRLIIERENVDGSMWELWGQMAQDNDTSFDARNEVSVQRGNQPDLTTFILNEGLTDANGNVPIENLGQFTSREQVLEANLLNLRGIPLDDGTIRDLGNGFLTGGANAIYDLNFRVHTNVEQYGTGLRFLSRPFMDSGRLKVSMGGGLRYMLLDEDFRFFGQDSGALYDNFTGNDPFIPDVRLHSIPNGLDDDSDGVVDNAGTIEDRLTGQGGGGGGQGSAARFLLNSVNDTSAGGAVYPITSILNNDIRTHLAGPEASINYQFGGSKGFRLGGRSNFGLMANHYKAQLSGDNIFVTTRLSNLVQPSAIDSRPNDFFREESHNSVSPLFEQTIYVEAPVFQYLPVLRRSSILSKADFRVDYTFTFIGEVARASDSILWQGNPSQNIFPDIDIDKSSWRSSTWHFGVTWKW